MFEGTITYNVIREFYGKVYHQNFKKIVCFISSDHYKEEFWADKKNKYFIRIFDFKNGELAQINMRHKVIHKSKLPAKSSIEIRKLNLKLDESKYEIKYKMDFGFDTSNLYTYKTDTGILINPNYAEHLRICSKIPIGNNEVASYFKEEPKFRYRQSKEYKLVGVQPKKIELSEFDLLNHIDFEINNNRINRYIHHNLWKNSEWKHKFERKMIAFYTEILKIDLSEEEKENIAAYNSIHFGNMNEDDYQLNQSKWRKFEREHDQ